MTMHRARSTPAITTPKASLAAVLHDMLEWAKARNHNPRGKTVTMKCSRLS